MARVVSVFARDLFAGKTACVTGGGSGIGFAIAAELNYLGCNVVIAGRNNEKLLDAAKNLTAMQTKWPSSSSSVKPDIFPIQCNIRNEEQVTNLIDRTLSRFGKLDYLVNNAGGQFISPLIDMKTKGWNAVIDTNLTGTFMCCREAVNRWMINNGGAIVNITVNNMRGFPLMGHSGAARAAVDNFTKTAALEWAHFGVRINCIEPGVIYNDSAAANYPPGLFERAANALPARRTGTVEEISSAVCFLLSPASAYITGVSMRIDGGQVLTNLFWPVPQHKNRWPAYGNSKYVEANDEEDSSLKSKL